MIPEAAVEAAARVAAQGEVEVYDWTEFADYARLILEAAAPHMCEAARDEGYRDGLNEQFRKVSE